MTSLKRQFYRRNLTPLNRMPDFEVCVETAQGLDACKGLADRIELCSALDIGGLTPSAGLMQAAKDSGIETHVLIRPTGGTFEMPSEDLAVALSDIEKVRSYGLHGVVIGATKEGQLDLVALREMADAADGLTLTLHRAFDVVEDQSAALEHAIELGFRRILTSGGAKAAPLGIDRLKHLSAQSRSRIEIMAGGGITPENVQGILTETGVDAVHSSCTTQVPMSPDLVQKGFGDFERLADRAAVVAMAKLVKSKV